MQSTASSDTGMDSPRSSNGTRSRAESSSSSKKYSLDACVCVVVSATCYAQWCCQSHIFFSGFLSSSLICNVQMSDSNSDALISPTKEVQDGL